MAKGCNDYREPDTVPLFRELFQSVLRGGTSPTMPKTIRVPNTSSSKTGSGATEGVLD